MKSKVAYMQPYCSYAVKCEKRKSEWGKRERE